MFTNFPLRLSAARAGRYKLTVKTDWPIKTESSRSHTKMVVKFVNTVSFSGKPEYLVHSETFMMFGMPGEGRGVEGEGARENYILVFHLDWKRRQVVYVTWRLNYSIVQPGAVLARGPENLRWCTNHNMWTYYEFIKQHIIVCMKEGHVRFQYALYFLVWSGVGNSRHACQSVACQLVLKYLLIYYWNRHRQVLYSWIRPPFELFWSGFQKFSLRGNTLFLQPEFVVVLVLVVFFCWKFQIYNKFIRPYFHY